MKKYFKTIITLLCLCLASPVFAQLYVIDDIFADSAQVFEIRMSKDGKYELLGKEAFKLPMGDTVRAVRLLENKSNISVVEINGKEYLMKSKMLLFSDTNPADAVDLLGDTRSSANHTAMGRFFATMTPYWAIAILFIVAMLFTFLGLKYNPVANIAVKVVPASILAASILEIWAFAVLKTDAFWWCSPDRFGFFGALLRVIPFLLFVCFQLYCIRPYMHLLTGDEYNNLSVKPMILSFGLSIPITIVVSLLCSGLLGIKSPWSEIITAVVFIISIVIGVLISAKRNFEELGKKQGLLFTIFGIIWAIGSLVAILGVFIVLIQLIIQTLMVAAIIFFFSFAMKSGAQSSGTQRNIMFRDESGAMHTNFVDRDIANKNIQANKDN